MRELQCLQVCQGQYRAEQLVYVAALACGIPLVFGDRPKDITYRQVTTRLQLVGPSNHTCHCLAAVTHHYVHLMLAIVALLRASLQPAVHTAHMRPAGSGFWSASSHQLPGDAGSTAACGAAG